MKRNQNEWTILGRFLRELTYFTQSERRGIIVLLLVTALAGTLPTILPYLLPDRQSKMIEYAEKADEQFALLEPEGENNRFYEKKDNRSVKGTLITKKNKTGIGQRSVSVLFPFNPNTLPKDSFILLGLSNKVVNVLEKYRTKGGQFSQKEDLLKIYGMTEPDFERLEPYITIPSTSAAKKTSHNEAYSKLTIDINTAQEEEWQKLKGIGPYYSKKIVAYRNALGGFKEIAQISEVYNLPDSVFKKIQPFLQLKDAQLKKIRLDSSGIPSLKTHPYISARQAVGLEAFIKNHGALKSPNTLLQTGLFSQEEYDRLAPYLE